MFARRTTVFQGALDGGWVRQQSVDGQAIIQAQWAAEDGLTLRGVRFFVFDQAGHIAERVEATEARLKAGFWELHKARVFPTGSEPETFESYLVSTNLTADQVRGSLGRRDALSFWDLPLAAEAAARAGLRSERYWLQYQQMLALPFTLVTMVLIAAAFGLRVFRLGGIGKMMLTGLAAGFLLYVGSRLGEELGINGVVPPVYAAWVPVLAWTLAGSWVLLHQEDG
jgi:lipopolysaccharide export system permease protein